MKKKTAKISLFLVALFGLYSTTVLACFDCEMFQADQTMTADCHDKDHPDSDKDDRKQQGQLECCCVKSPVKNPDANGAKISYFPTSFLFSLDAVARVSISVPVQAVDHAWTRYHPYSAFSHADTLALKQSFLI